MKLDRVRFDISGVPYVEYTRKSGRQIGQTYREYGKIVKCIYCGGESFSSFYKLLKRQGKFCSLSCRSKKEFNNKWRGGVSLKEAQKRYKRKNRERINFMARFRYQKKLESK